MIADDFHIENDRWTTAEDAWYQARGLRYASINYMGEISILDAITLLTNTGHKARKLFINASDLREFRQIQWQALGLCWYDGERWSAGNIGVLGKMQVYTPARATTSIYQSRVTQ